MHDLLRPLAATLATAALACAQAVPLQSTTVPVAIDSGYVANTSTSPATAGMPQVVWSTVVTAPAAATWLRLVYGGVLLGGAPDRGRDGSFLRITSLKDGHQQTQHRVHVGQWRDTSAYFNGDAVLVELLAHQGTGPNRLVIHEVIAGPSQWAFPDSICGSTDDRLPSSDPRVARLMPIGCTGWLIDDCNGCLITAGHCTSSSLQVVQFNYPLSSSSGSPQNPAPQDQYPIDASSMQSNGGQGTGNDWAYFGVHPNSNTGLLPAQVQGAVFQLQLPPPVSPGSQIRITGNGSTSSPISPTWNLAQKTHVGPFVTSQGSLLQYATDTTGGNSGSPIIYESTGMAIGVHTHAGCSSTGGQNNGTGINHPDFQAALANPRGICYCPDLVFSYPNGLPASVLPDGTTTVRVQVAAANAQPQPNSGVLHVAQSAGFTTVPMTEVAPNVYDATFPMLSCGAPVRFYFSAQTTTGQVVPDLQQAPNQTHEALVGQSVTVVRDYDFESAPPGWTVQNTSVAAGAWQRGTPAGGGSRRDPASDYDGSGQCWVTGLGANVDLDGGPTRLVTETMNLSALGDPRVSYARWLRNDDGDDFLVVEISGDGGSTWTTVETIGGDVAAWVTADWRVLDHVTSLSQVRLRFSVADAPNNSVTECGLDAFKVYDVSCNQATWSMFGAPCLGTYGVPLLSSNGVPQLGSTLQITVSNVGAGLPVMLTGLNNTAYNGSPLPAPLASYGFGVGCQLLVRPDVSDVLANQGGTATWSVAIPADPSFAGLRLYNQAAVLGPVSAVSFGSVGLVF